MAAPVNITLETLRNFADVPLSKAATHLGISPTAMKKACRKLGVTRWPYRSTSAPPPETVAMANPAVKQMDSAYVRKLFRKYSGSSRITDFSLESLQGESALAGPPPSGHTPAAEGGHAAHQPAAQRGQMQGTAGARLEAVGQLLSNSDAESAEISETFASGACGDTDCGPHRNCSDAGVLLPMPKICDIPFSPMGEDIPDFDELNFDVEMSNTKTCSELGPVFCVA